MPGSQSAEISQKASARGSRKEEVTAVCRLPLFRISPLTECPVEQASANYMLSAFYKLRLQGKGADDELMRVTDSDGQNQPFKTAIIA